MRNFSKSKLMALRQCEKRLWLEVHRPDLREDSEQAEYRFQVGHQVGDMARALFDPDGKGALIDIDQEGFAAAFARSAELLKQRQPIFEAGFSGGGRIGLRRRDASHRTSGRVGLADDRSEVIHLRQGIPP